ncbi:unnamed protein product [Thlaspi arvense]|uniref:RING-type domain-containing protein n=1 Tax=Thlaspi arvense TaxID=13288 RepID=A0AAU9RDN9_THLAR|nr:unnamed protein product [Thlaspi arvense]
MAANKCSRCDEVLNLYLTECRHSTVCFGCGKTMAEEKEACAECGTIVTQLVKEFDLRISSPDDKKFFFGKFPLGTPYPNFKNDHAWSLSKNSLPNDNEAGSSKNVSWVLKDETDNTEYVGRCEKAGSTSEFLLMRALLWQFRMFRFAKVRDLDRLTIEQLRADVAKREKALAKREKLFKKHEEKFMRRFAKKRKLSSKKEAGSSPSNEEAGSSPSREEAGSPPSNEEAGSYEKGEDWEHEDVFTDDEEVDLGESLEAPEEFQDENDREPSFLSHSGKDMQNLVAVSEKNQNESDGMKIDVKGSTSAAGSSEKKTDVEEKSDVAMEDYQDRNT